MRISENNEVQEFLNAVSMMDSDKFESLNTMREIVFNNYPNTEERMMYGGIMFSLKTNDYGGLFIRKKHISFEFVKDFLMNDPKKLLEGDGKYRRHLKIKTIDDIKNKEVDYFVKQAV